MDYNLFASKITIKESGKKKLNIADVKEVLRLTNDELNGKLYKLIEQKDEKSLPSALEVLSLLVLSGVTGLITSKLVGLIDWSWWLVLSPLWLPILLAGSLFSVCMLLAMSIGFFLNQRKSK